MFKLLVSDTHYLKIGIREQFLQFKGSEGIKASEYLILQILLRLLYPATIFNIITRMIDYRLTFTNTFENLRD